MFVAAHQWGLAPSEFWNMTFTEWFSLYAHYMSQQGIAGTSITHQRQEELKAWAETARERLNFDRPA